MYEYCVVLRHRCMDDGPPMQRECSSSQQYCSRFACCSCDYIYVSMPIQKECSALKYSVGG